MAYPDWPSLPGQLPWVVLNEGYVETAPNLVVRSKMDVGPDKIRRRATAGVRPIKAHLRLTKAQIDILDNFYLVTCAGGSTQFSWWLQRNGGHVRTQAYFRFVSPPVYQSVGAGYYTALLDLEVMP